MDFTLSKSMADKVAPMALSMGESDEVWEIPDSGGQVLIRCGSTAYQARLDRKTFMFPVKLWTEMGGVRKESLFCVCIQ